MRVAFPFNDSSWTLFSTPRRRRRGITGVYFSPAPERRNQKGPVPVRGTLKKNFWPERVRTVMSDTESVLYESATVTNYCSALPKNLQMDDTATLPGSLNQML